jgi:hypothetical protein
MSELTDALDGMCVVIVETMTKEQIARMAVGYFAAVESWKIDPWAVDGLMYFHESIAKKLTGGAYRDE